MRRIRLRGTDVMLAGVSVGGLGALIAALWLTDAGLGEWAAGVLVNLGAAVLLVVPLYLLNRRLDARIENVRAETKASVEALTDRVSTVEHEVGLRIDDVAASVSKRLAEERVQDLAAFDSLVEMPTWQTVREALRRADALGLISRERGPRVCVSEEWRVFLRIDFQSRYTVEVGGPDGYITLTIESFDGGKIDQITWERGENFEEVMVRVGRAVQRLTSGTNWDIRAFFNELRDALAVAHTSPERRPVWQLCPPQWIVTDRSVVSYGNGRGPYGVAIPDLKNDPHLSVHVREKPWVDVDSFEKAEHVGITLFEEPPPF